MVQTDIKMRISTLKRLRDALLKYERPLCDALWQDLHKSYEEAYITELSIVLDEINTHIVHLCSWAMPRWVATPLKLFPSMSRIVCEPLGKVLIIAPWNYPVQLLLVPLVGAISAGCSVVLKTSPYAPEVGRVIADMISEVFDKEEVSVVQGHRDVVQNLLSQRWDFIFFTGSPALGRVVMEAAAKNLTPVVLELGGKSPCIVDRSADLKVAAKRIAWGKLLNAGQTCIAPDYLYVQESVKEAFLEQLKLQFDKLLQGHPESALHFARIVKNDRAFERLTGYLKDGKVVYGGQFDASSRFIAPTILDDVSLDSPVMQEEIFGPVFPVLTFRDLRDVVEFLDSREKPLALYYFGSEGEYVSAHTSSGACCINDCIMHIANHNLPFGGVGNSGMGAYHGKLSFDVFTHRKAILSTPRSFDVPFRYMPYKFFKYIKKILART